MNGGCLAGNLSSEVRHQSTSSAVGLSLLQQDRYTHECVHIKDLNQIDMHLISF